MTIKIHHLRPAPGAKSAKTRVGRGEATKGQTAGRGMKGTKARKTVPPGFEGGQMPIQIRLPKLRGFKNHFRTEYQPVNVGEIARAFPEGGAVSAQALAEKGLVRKARLVKVLGDGAVDGVKLDVTADKFSASARTKLEAAGGTATVQATPTR